MADTLFTPYVTRLLECLCAQMNALPEAQRPARCCVKFSGTLPTMGISVNEDECKCTTAWVRLVTWYPTSNDTFPAPDTTPEASRCMEAWGLVLEMGVGRCPPIGDAQNLPSCEQQNDFAQIMRDDAAAFRKAVRCCFAVVDPLLEFTMGEPQIVGPAGACIQQTLNVTVMVVACDEC